MRQYTVTGMTCAACQSHVEKAVAEVPGVSSVAVALLTNSMAVNGTASDEEIIRAVENAGYGARLKGEEKKKYQELAKQTVLRTYLIPSFGSFRALKSAYKKRHEEIFLLETGNFHG